MPELTTKAIQHIIYNPDLLSKAELIGCFVARTALLDRLLTDLRLEGDAGSPQHQLIVGHRGMGKTTLLRRLAYAIEDDPVLNTRWLPLTFREEQYNVARLSDLWLNCVDALSDSLERQGDPAAAHDLDTALDALPRTEDATLQRAALDLLLNTSTRLDRRLVLMLDNLGLILDRLKKDESWSFRETLSTCDRILIVGGSAYHLEETYTYDAPFYDFFHLHELRGLTTAETHDVLLTLARRTHAPQVEQLLGAEPARIKTLHVLTGGNPRTINLLFEILAAGLSADVEADLTQLLDRCTPLYKARLEALAPQAQHIVDAVATHWDPISAAELAALTRLDTNAVSAQLTRLVRDGIIEKLEHPFDVPGLDPDQPANRKLGYQIAERFFNIWHLMRSSRRVRRRLLWLVRFMTMLFTPEQLRGYATHHLEVGCGPHASDKRRYAEYGLALAMAVDDPAYRGALEHAGLQAMVNDDGLRQEIHAILDLDGEDGHLKPHVDRLQTLAYQDRWPEAVEHARVFIAGPDDFHARIWDDILTFFQEAVRHGHAREAVELLDACDVTERWRPLREALVALAVGDEGYLKRVAPEVREPALMLVARLKAAREAARPVSPER